MKCLKCGVDISEDEVFCMECLLEAQRYPVDPAAAVYLPKREKAETPKKSPRRRTQSAEDQIRLLKRRLRLQAALLVLMTAIVLGITYPALTYLAKNHHRTGQNYSAMTTAPSATTVPPVATVP